MPAARVIEDNNSKEDSVFFFLTTVSATENRGENEFLPRSPTVVERHARRRFSAATRRADAADGWFRVGLDGRDPARATAASYLAQEVILHMRARPRARGLARVGFATRCGGFGRDLWRFRVRTCLRLRPTRGCAAVHARSCAHLARHLYLHCPDPQEEGCWRPARASQVARGRSASAAASRRAQMLSRPARASTRPMRRGSPPSSRSARRLARLQRAARDRSCLDGRRSFSRDNFDASCPPHAATTPTHGAPRRPTATRRVTRAEATSRVRAGLVPWPRGRCESRA